jgi:ferredoxin
MRKRALQLETHLRRAVAGGARGLLSAMWRAAAAELRPAADAESYEREMTTVLAAFACDGELAGCDAELAARYLRHAWDVAQREKARSARERIELLALRLEEILRADYARSPAALTGPNLQATFGPAHRELFDFAAMSRLLNSRAQRSGLSDSRRQRIETALATLRSQEFYAAADESHATLTARFVFDSTGDALDAFLQRLPHMLALHRALQVAELEAEGLYAEGTHDAILQAMDESSLGASDLQFFPDYLVCTGAGDAAAMNPALLEALGAGVPIKVLVQLDELLELSQPGRLRSVSGLRSAQLATTAMSGEAFVLQTTASNLLQMRDAVQRGLRHPGPALFAVYCGPAQPAANGLPPYLLAAAARQSRALPTFVYDPGAGGGLAERFSLANNPQQQRDWPVDTLAYADQDLQAVTEEVAFTVLDFALCDPRYASHFAVVPRSQWGDGMIPAAQWLEHPPGDPSQAAPYVVAVDEADLLCRLVVDEKLMRAALRCRERWHRLQELGRVHEPKLSQPVTASPVATDASATSTPAEATPAAAEPASAEPAAADAAAAPDPDVARIETLRCSSCNECTLAFPKMFAYNDDKQAYIRDVRAGTYRQLVEAAESCQVSVIHPGKPWNPDEPGLEELLERARPFM